MPNATVLVVDDEPLIRWSLINRLKEEGYRTLEAGTAGDAVAQHREGADLVLLDFALPDANGLDVLKQIKETDSDTLVIMLTSCLSLLLACGAVSIFVTIGMVIGGALK
jgi:DNA-binding response OmpR family regulator